MNFPQASARWAASLVRATWLVTGIVKQWTRHSNKLHYVEIYSLRFEVDIFSEFMLLACRPSWVSILGKPRQANSLSYLIRASFNLSRV